MPNRTKWKDGDVVGPWNILLKKVLGKDDKNQYIGQFECPYDGNLFVTRISNVSCGDTRSCGCLSKANHKKISDYNRQKYVGEKIGKLTPLYPTDKRDADGRVIWHCKCDCGNECDVSTHYLNKKGSIPSCGCLRKEMGKKYIKDLTGQKFGYLKVIRDSGKRYVNKSGSNVIWTCECTRDGNLKEVRAGDLTSGRVISCGCCVMSYYEHYITDILNQLGVNYFKQYIFSDCINPKTNYNLYFDFYLPDFNCCIEYDGKQHYEEVPFFQETLSDRQYRDEIKNQYCNKKNIKLIRIPYWDNKKINVSYIKQLLVGQDS